MESDISSLTEDVRIVHEEDSNNELSHNSHTVEGEENCDIDNLNMPSVGDLIEVFWPFDDKFYPGTVGEYNQDFDTFHVD